MRAFLSILLIIFCLNSWAELDDSYSVASPYLVSQEELDAIRDQTLPIELRQNPKSEFIKAVNKQKRTLDEWVQSLQERQTSVLCLGETHTEVYRRVMAEKILPHLKMSTLSVEMVQEELEGLKTDFNNLQPVKWLGADFSSILQVVHQQGMGFEDLLAIEQTKPQQMASLKEKISSPDARVLTRDGFIAKNFLKNYRPEGLNVILYGANHCSNFDKGLPLEVPMFRRIKNFLGEERVESVLPVPLSQKSHPLVAYFLSMGLTGETMVLPNFRSIPPKAFNYRYELITYQMNYDTIILVQDR